MRILLSSIGIFLKIRKAQISNFFQLIDSILPKVITIFTKEEIMSLFRRKEIHLYLLKKCTIDINDIAIYYGIKSPKLQFFYPELTALQTAHPTIILNSKQDQKYREVIEYFTTNDREQDDPRLKGSNIDSLSVIIQRDDIELFQKTVSHKNIDIQKHKLQISLFESNKCMRDSQFYLIEYAAFHSSLRIFKYLMLNNATFSEDLLKCSFCGGCSEIIHLSEEAIKRSLLNPELNEILKLTITFHRYELTEYLIENYSIKNGYQDWLISIISSNYYFFANHIFELSDKVNRLPEIENLSESDMTFANRIKKLVLLAAAKVDTFFLEMSTKIVKFNFNDTEKVDEREKTICNPLICAIQQGNVEGAKYLLSLETVDPDYKVAFNTTPFLWACYMGRIEIVKYLVENYCFEVINKSQQNSTEKSHQNSTEKSQQNSTEKSQQNSTEKSHQNSTEKSHQNSTEKSHQNSTEKSHQIMKEHFAFNVNNSIHNKRINIKSLVDQSNENALHLATRGCHLDVVAYLVSLGEFDLSAKTIQGETAIQCAARLGYKEIFDFLKESSIEAGIEVDDNIKVNKERFLPQLHLKSINLFINFYEGIKNPNDISTCLLL